MQRRKEHHLPDDVFKGQNHVVSLTVCTANRGRWLALPAMAAIARDEIVKLHRDHTVIGYCIMPDHVHVVMANSGATPGMIVGGFKGRTSLRVHRIQKGLETWQPGYWDHIVRKTEGLYAVLRYILLNPVRAGLVRDWWEYEWSGSPLMGAIGPQFFTSAAAEDIVWGDLLAGEP